MSHHFRMLREAGLVETRVQGTTHLNAFSRASVDAAFPGLLVAVLGGTAEETRPVDRRRGREQ